MKPLYGTLSADPTALELANRALARRAAAEGFVLLKNEGGALPLQTRNIALYGMGARQTVKGGLGSGSVEERYSVTIEQGLQNAGYTVTTTRWLDDYDAEHARTYAEYHDMVESKVAGLTDPMQIIPLAHSYVYRYPSGRAITAQDIADSDTDTALYVLTRQAGECNDRRLEPGDYCLTDTERGHLRTVAEGYAHTILVINVGGLIDLGFLDEIPGIDAVVLFVQGGEEGGNALADVLSGKVNFSGRLADTIPLRYEDIPFGGEFSHLDGNVENENYKEGIFVGYRYFDSFDKPVRYPFGYGLSYTTFAMRTVDATLNGTALRLDVEVTNTGAVPGKQVVQLYVSTPPGKLTKEYQRLAAFAKTETLAPGACVRLELTMDLADCASYDETRAAWVLEAGDYLFRLGASSRDTAVAAVVTLPAEVITRQCRSCCAPADDLGAFAPAVPRQAGEIPETAFHLTADPDTFRTVQTDYAEPAFAETPEETSFLDSLTAEEMTELLCGGALQNVPEGALEIPGAGGKTATSLLDKGLNNLVMADGPAGVNICNKLRLLPNGRYMAAEIPERYDWGLLSAAIRRQLAGLPQGKIVYRYATAWPVEILLAQSWNAPLLRQVGEGIGKEMAAFGVSVWLGPAVNIHRNPLGGRTFEYYSEDPVLTGVLAAAVIQGVQSQPGAGVSIKHFCCNNSEDNRNGLSANVGERALREIYLKGFEIAVRTAHPRTVMSSYNQLNHVYTANRHDLLTDILRCEWGFDGLVMTDWGSTNPKAGDPTVCAAAGNDLIMPGNPYDHEQLKAAVADGRLAAVPLRRAAARVLQLILNGVTPAWRNDAPAKEEEDAEN